MAFHLKYVEFGKRLIGAEWKVGDGVRLLKCLPIFVCVILAKYNDCVKVHILEEKLVIQHTNGP